jgi:tetratricopeptide (TPR) repeat protein
MKRHLFILLLTLIPLVLLFQGCIKLALRTSPSLFPNIVSSIFEECNPELAKNSIPANLKLLEGLLKNDSDNRQILTTLCMGFCGYSMLFVENENPTQASQFYLRAREYGIAAIGKKGRVFTDLKLKDIRLVLMRMGEDDLEALLWVTTSWNAWISLNLDDPKAIAQITVTQACLERLLEINPNYFHGLPYILMGSSLAARPPLLGGNTSQAKDYFEKALALNQGRFPLTQYYYARYYAVQIQDKTLFTELLSEVAYIDPNQLQDVCLINTVFKEKATQLKNMSDELFL